MFRNSYQRGMLTVFYSCGSKPLALWDVFTENGHVSRFMDPDIKSTVLEIGGTNISTTYMLCPKGKAVLGITMPFLVMIVKNLRKYFSFEVTALDETGQKRRFRVSNFQSTTQIMPLSTVMPIGLTEGWNQIQFNLAEFMRRAYRTQFVEVLKLKINANIRLRRIYFTERLLPEDQLPPEYRLFFPLTSIGSKDRKKDSENIPLVPSASTHPSEEAIGGKVSTSKDVIRRSSSARQKKSLLENIDKVTSSHLKQPTIPEGIVPEEKPEKHSESPPSEETPAEAADAGSVKSVVETEPEIDTVAEGSAEAVVEAVAISLVVAQGSTATVVEDLAKDAAETLGNDITEIPIDEDTFDESSEAPIETVPNQRYVKVANKNDQAVTPEEASTVVDEP